MFRQKGFDISRKSLNRTLILGGALLIVIVAAVAYFRNDAGIEGSTYQLVRLDNGESYVGRLSGIGNEYANLATPFIYKEPTDKQGEATSENEIQLLRVSSVDGDLRIATDKIVYWGNLPKEGKVVNAIKSLDK